MTMRLPFANTKGLGAKVSLSGPQNMKLGRGGNPPEIEVSYRHEARQWMCGWRRP